jgi:hypothetical protein
MSKVKAEKLDADALLWAVCLALGHAPVLAATGIAYRSDHGSWVYPRFTSDQEAGELMASEWIGVERPCCGQKTPVWRAIADSKEPTKPHEFCGGVVAAWGDTLGVAVCRALVLSRLGVAVDVPEELLRAIPA